MSHKILAIIQLCKSKLALKLNKPEMWILEFKSFIMITSKINITTNQHYFSQTLIVYCIVIIRLSQNMMMSQKKLVIEK